MQRVAGSVRHRLGAAVIRAGLRLRGRGGLSSDVDYRRPLSRSEARAILDERTRQHLGLNADQFIEALRAGSLPDTSTVRGLAMLAGEDF